MESGESLQSPHVDNMTKSISHLFLLAAVLTACNAPSSDLIEEVSSGEYSRIISMAPSTTELLFELGLGEEIVGVTRYCIYPPEAQAKELVGGFLDPNYEAILALEPDLVVLLPVHGDVIGKIEELGIETLVVDHRTLDGILDSIDAVGERCGRVEEARLLRNTIETRLEEIELAHADVSRPSVLLSSARSYGSGRIGDVYVAGKNQWYDDVIRFAGGKNAFTDESIPFPSLSGEALLVLDPDVIVELAPDLRDTSVDAIVAEWGTLPTMRAVRNGRVYVLQGDHVAIPGPRFVQIIEDLAAVLHPAEATQP